ncbi:MULTISPECIES: hypothetical protein [unclassified Microcoleus]|uniref:hypothetical protein n=1 Tax=unclassified Microcoleus TaxID=2642155 RepID=UPI002FD70457
MAVITPGDGGTIQATTAEGQAFQLLQWWQLQEENQAINPNGEEYFTGSKNTDTNNKFFEGTWKIPANFSPAPLVLSASEIYQGLTFIRGTGGTFGSISPTAYTLEVLLWLVQRENDSTFNPDRFNYITARYDANLRIFEGTFKLPYQTSLLPNGGTQDTARTYLL